MCSSFAVLLNVADPASVLCLDTNADSQGSEELLAVPT